MDFEQADLEWLRKSFAVAARSRENGNHPFGAVLVGPKFEFLLEAENTVLSGNDITEHAEINLVRMALADYDPRSLALCTIYASTEPCPMCAGAIFWSGIGRVVYGVSEAGLYRLVGEESEEVLQIPCRELLAHGRRNVEVVGPLLEEEGLQVHEGFWGV
ncbi:MAG TPA: nucleoside deaminase [Chloroflexi bacterium]|nr:MAG: nucleoside deaminase [Chloroflexota bacterium]HDD54680.1 nucleoside deaminase [Chloroflexota bacterium]